MSVHFQISSFMKKKIGFYHCKTTLTFLLLLSFEDNTLKILTPQEWNQHINSVNYIMGLFHLPKACILSIEFDVPGPQIGNCIKKNIF